MNVVYLCPYCRDRKGHKDPRQVRICQIQATERPTPDEIFEYCCLKDEIEKVQHCQDDNAAVQK